MLRDVELSSELATHLWTKLLENIQLWLACNVVHGDLSPFNVLFDAATARTVVIDFPQAVDPRVNPSAFELLVRDIDNLRRYFARAGIEASAFELADRYWSAWARP
jgi:RIO kinase 1